MSATDRIPCPVDACAALRQRRYLMCPRHWREVPPDLKVDVQRHYRPHRGPFQTEAYFEARERAIAVVAGREPDLEGAQELARLGQETDDR